MKVQGGTAGAREQVSACRRACAERRIASPASVVSDMGCAPQAGIISEMMDDAMEDNSEEIEDETEAEIDKARCVSALAMHACLKASYC